MSIQQQYFLLIALILLISVVGYQFYGSFRVKNLQRQGYSSPNYHYSRRQLRSFATFCEFLPTSDYAKLGKKQCDIIIQSMPGNRRLIQANMIVNSAVENVWSILTDYTNLPKHVPNMVKSEILPCPDPKKIRLFQEGAQKVMGFDFRASLVLDMIEKKGGLSTFTTTQNLEKEWTIPFQLVSSSIFDEFDGAWTLQPYHKWQEYDTTICDQVWKYKTRLQYHVTVHPKIPVPMIALEWRIREDIPANLFAIKVAAERLPSPTPS